MITLFVEEPFAEGEVRLDGAPVQHARARRVSRGESVRLVDGRGRVGLGKITSVGKDRMEVSVEQIQEFARPSALEIVIPVADRDRMLVAAEKCVELGVTGWRPAYFARSRSVSPRGEGDKFREKTRARMQSALEQSGSAWLPEIHDEAEIMDVLESLPRYERLMLDATGVPLPTLVTCEPVAIAVGPEGGIEPTELDAARNAGWKTVSLGATVLRFETAVIAGAAVVRAGQFALGRS